MTTQPENNNSIEPKTIFDFSKIITAIIERKLQILKFVGAVTFAIGILLFLLPNKYTAETSLLPEIKKNDLLGLSGGADFAALTGMNLGETPVSRLYPMIIRSSRVLREVIYSKYLTTAFADSVDLIRFWDYSDKTEEEKYEKALKLLQDRMEVTFDNRLGTLVLRVELEEPRLAAEVANNITQELDLYTRKKKITNATLQREFIEKRLDEVQKELNVAENTLKSFRTANRRVSESPQLIMLQARLERDLQINSTVFIELKKQVEVAKIEEIKNIPLINVLDYARVPVKKSSPKRLLYLFIICIASLLLAIAHVVLLLYPQYSTWIESARQKKYLSNWMLRKRS